MFMLTYLNLFKIAILIGFSIARVAKIDQAIKIKIYNPKKIKSNKGIERLSIPSKWNGRVKDFEKDRSHSWLHLGLKYLVKPADLRIDPSIELKKRSQRKKAARANHY
jgi:hypothetical protein